MGIFNERNSSAILSGLAVFGVLSTAVIAYKNTKHAMQLIEEENYNLMKLNEPDLSKREELQLTWKCYIPTAISVMGTIGCVIGSYYCSAKQTEALSSAYLLSQATLHEYQRKVTDKIGENKEKEIRYEVMKELANNKAPAIAYTEESDVIETGHGKTLFYDIPGDVYFKSDINFVRATVNDLNHDVRTEMEFDWNEMRYRLGLPNKKFGSQLIFDVDRPLEIELEPELMENGQVRILFNYELYPKYP